jgi:hypothetical protein
MLAMRVTAILEQVDKYPTPLPLIALLSKTESPSDGHPIKQQQFTI